MTKAKREWAMSLPELEAATAEFETEGVAETFRPLSPKEKKVWAAAAKKRPRGRPRVGKGVKVIFHQAAIPSVPRIVPVRSVPRPGQRRIRRACQES